jgi:hypothetical protein
MTLVAWKAQYIRNGDGFYGKGREERGIRKAKSKVKRRVAGGLTGRGLEQGSGCLTDWRFGTEE